MFSKTLAGRSQVSSKRLFLFPPSFFCVVPGGRLAGSRAGRTKNKKIGERQCFPRLWQCAPGVLKNIVFDFLVFSRFFLFGPMGAGWQQGSKFFLPLQPSGEASGGASGGAPGGGIWEVLRIKNGFRKDSPRDLEGLRKDL